MAATTITVQDILFYLAHRLGAVRSAYVSEVLSTTQWEIGGVSLGIHETFRGGLARFGPNGTRKISDYNDAAQNLTVASAFAQNPVVDDYLELAWWDPTERSIALGAIEDAVRESYPGWRRQVDADRNVHLDSSGASLTLPTIAAGTDTYALPTELTHLLAVGIQADTSQAPKWYPPQNIWRVTGSPGAFSVRFHPTSSRDFVAVNDTQSLCLRYAVREPVPTSEASTTQLPMEYFRYAAWLFLQRISLVNPERWLPLHKTSLPWVQQEAGEALAQAGVLLPPMEAPLAYGRFA